MMRTCRIGRRTHRKAGSRKIQEQGKDESTSKLKRLSDKALATLKTLEAEVKKHEDETETLAKNLKVVSTLASPAYIYGSKGKFHTGPFGKGVHKGSWRCKCGWPYARSSFERWPSIPEGTPVKQKCFTCFDISSHEIPDVTDGSE